MATTLKTWALNDPVDHNDLNTNFVFVNLQVLSLLAEVPGLQSTLAALSPAGSVPTLSSLGYPIVPVVLKTWATDAEVSSVDLNNNFALVSSEIQSVSGMIQALQAAMAAFDAVTVLMGGQQISLGGQLLNI